jgi:hypothetical protein
MNYAQGTGRNAVDRTKALGTRLLEVLNDLPRGFLDLFRLWRGAPGRLNTWAWTSTCAAMRGLLGAEDGREGASSTARGVFAHQVGGERHQLSAQLPAAGDSRRIVKCPWCIGILKPVNYTLVRWPSTPASTITVSVQGPERLLLPARLGQLPEAGAGRLRPACPQGAQRFPRRYPAPEQVHAGPASGR